MNESISGLKREAYIETRGKTLKTGVGFVLRLARENLKSHFLSQKEAFERDLDALTEEHSFDELLWMTSGSEEYKFVRRLLKKGLYKVRYTEPIQAQSDANAEEAKVPERDVNYDSEDPEEYKDIDLFSGPDLPKSSTTRKTNIKPIKKLVDKNQMEEKFSVSTCVCFIKISSFKKQVIGDILNALINVLELEVLGLKVIRAKKELYKDIVPLEVQKIVKSVAYKFHEVSNEIKLRRKLVDFTTFALVLRGQNVQG